MRIYNSEDFKTYFAAFQEQLAKYKASNFANKLKVQILSLLGQMKKKFLAETINAFLLVWMPLTKEHFFEKSE